MPPNGSGSAKGWRPCSPALAAGLADHGWMLREVVRYRVPPWPQPLTVSETVLVDAHGVEQRTGAQRQAKRGARGGKNLFGVLITGWLTRHRRIGRSLKTLSARSRYATQWGQCRTCRIMRPRNRLGVTELQRHSQRIAHQHLCYTFPSISMLSRHAPPTSFSFCPAAPPDEALVLRHVAEQARDAGQYRCHYLHRCAGHIQQEADDDQHYDEQRRTDAVPGAR